MSRARAMIVALLALAGACESTRPEVDRLACDGCHAPEYDRARDRDGLSHADKGFLRTCYTCHGTGVGRPTPDAGAGEVVDAGPGAWLPANEDHCGYPIDGEPHAGWDCYACHDLDQPLDDTTSAEAIREHVTCTGCHWHDRARVDPLHGEPVFDEDRCIRCHGESRCR
jgi:hypothetical protein